MLRAREEASSTGEEKYIFVNFGTSELTNGYCEDCLFSLVQSGGERGVIGIWLCRLYEVLDILCSAKLLVCDKEWCQRTYRTRIKSHYCLEPILLNLPAADILLCQTTIF